MSYSGNTLAFQAKARGSIPLIRLNNVLKKLKIISFKSRYFDTFAASAF